MAAKKTAKAKKTARDKNAEKTPRKNAASAKKAKKGAPPVEGKKKRGRPKSATPKERKKVTTLIKEADIPPKALKLIQQADKLEQDMADAIDRFRDKLGEIPEVLGGNSFEHPERGPMTIMQRGYWFWRAKPSGTSG